MTKQTTLDIQGMTCPACIRHVTSALTALAGVSSVDVELRDGRATVTHATDSSLAEMIAALADAGYFARERPV